ncbi:hydroxypyruvate isomerase family protein [Halarchaeum sp. CBA1220]|uniref:hydroxypyruvate isomerase family protein n=1 Tax=Halarchaeum sp. CBA1220 TaxID=1853682 RepID=UPI002103948C|nr:TIM barrel protein [Halarchaeum sp. CBA1220]
MSFDVGVTVPMVYDCGLREGIERAAAAGADAVEFFDWEAADIDAVRETAEASGVAVSGVLAAGAGANIDSTERPALSYPEDRERAVADLERSVETAADLGASAVITTVGQRVDTLSAAAQQNAVVRVLREVAPTAEAHDVTVVLEPLNARVDHPGYFVRTSDRGFEIVAAVDSPNVKLLYDVYHQQITEGNVTQTLTEHGDLVGHVHVADVPGRHEPGTGELDYAHVLGALDEAGYDGVVSGEFAPSGDPDAAVESFVALADAVRE